MSPRRHYRHHWHHHLFHPTQRSVVVVVVWKEGFGGTKGRFGAFVVSEEMLEGFVVSEEMLEGFVVSEEMLEAFEGTK